MKEHVIQYYSYPYMRPSEDISLLIGKLLVRQGIITESQLSRVLDVQREKLRELGKHVYLGTLIVELGYATEEELVKTINSYYHLSADSLTDNIDELIRKKQKSLSQTFSKPRIPIWLQLSIATIFIIILTIFSLSIVILRQQKTQLYNQTVKIGVVSLNYFTNNARILILEDDIVGLNTLIKEAADVEGLLYAVIVDQKGQIKAHTDYRKIGEKFERFGSSDEVTTYGNVSYFSYISNTGERILNLERKITFKDKYLGEANVGVSIDFIQQLFYEKSVLIVMITAIVIFFGIVIAVLLGIRFSRPVSKLVLATQEIGKGNYRYTVDMNRNDEFGNLATAFNRMSRDLWRKSLMQESFGKYVGPEIVEMIMANPENTWLKGHRNEATILFTDIRGFTSYTEEMEPEKVVDYLNAYFEIATNAILKYGGYIDKFIGDAVLGIFGVPVYHENHIERGLRAANDMQEAFLNAASDNPFLSSVGISINSGVVVSGNIGSQVKMEYTVIGDSVNVASRLNMLAGPGEIIISKSVYEMVKEMIEAESLPPQMIKGKSKPVELFKVLKVKRNQYAEGQ